MAMRRYKAGLRERDLKAMGAVQLLERKKLSDSERQTVHVLPIVAWRVERWARWHGVTKTQAMDIAINRALDEALRKSAATRASKAA